MATATQATVVAEELIGVHESSVGEVVGDDVVGMPVGDTVGVLVDGDTVGTLVVGASVGEVVGDDVVGLLVGTGAYGHAASSALAYWPFTRVSVAVEIDAAFREKVVILNASSALTVVLYSHTFVTPWAAPFWIGMPATVVRKPQSHAVVSNVTDTPARHS